MYADVEYLLWLVGEEPMLQRGRRIALVSRRVVHQPRAHLPCVVIVVNFVRVLCEEFVHHLSDNVAVGRPVRLLRLFVTSR
jgi:hypothetical protein